MRTSSIVSRLVLGLSLTTMAVQAAVIFDTTVALTLADPTQLGRLGRNGVAQDWTLGETFPGVINTSTTYHYRVFSIPNPNHFTFIQVLADSTSNNLFASAYLGAYLPNSAAGPNFGFNTNWLGDAGTSGNSFGTDPLFFQVVIPSNGNLLVVLNNTGAGNVGVGNSFHLTVEGFYDTQFGDTPEPSSISLLSAGLVALGVKFAKRRSSQAA